MNEKAEILLELYKLQVHRSEHYESLRSSMVNILFVVAALLTSIAAFDSKFSGSDVWIGATLTVLGIFGFLASFAHGRRSWRHGKRAEKIRDELDLAFPDPTINKILDKVPKKRTRLNDIWNVFPMVVAFLGGVITILAVFDQGA